MVFQAPSEGDRRPPKDVQSIHVWVMPPDIPEDVATAMKNAFLQAVNDPAYIADMEKTRREVYPLAGDDLRAQAEGYAKLSQEARDILARMHTAGRGN